MKVLLSHSGKQHSYQVAKAMKDLNVLERYFTSSYITSFFLQRYFIRSGNSFWSRRFLPGLGGKDVSANWRFEIKEMLFARMYGQNEKTVKAIYERDVKFDSFVSQKVSQHRADIFWGFQGSCFKSLRAANDAGMKTICELATAHAPSAIRILKEEQMLHPEWADSIDNVSFPQPYLERLIAEPHEAKFVVSASSFTTQTLLDDGVDESKIRFLPLGFELNHIPFETNIPRRTNGRLKLLYAGRVTQRKGIKYLLEAMERIDHRAAELHVIGHVHGSGDAFRKYSNVVYHPPMHQLELFRKYSEYDAFVLPSVFEGFGLVILEAMAAGLPVITTPHTIGPEIVVHGKNGYLVPIRDVEAIQNAIQEFLGKSDEERQQMRLAARASAMDYSWNAYQLKLKNLLSTIAI